MKYTNIYNCCVVELSKIHDRAGNITVVENYKLPFLIKRIYYLYDVPSGSNRGGHAHKEMHHLMIAASGSFDILLDDGKARKVVKLNRPNFGLHIPPGIWVEVLNFSSGAISLNLVSTKFYESDYIRDYQDFKSYKNVQE
jgi:dTDP-4-dehydrorhamnose 3,5-epimerase-like enzyme